MYGCDCYAYGLLAAGLADVVCEADLKPYDYMALVPVIKVGLPLACLQNHRPTWWFSHLSLMLHGL